MEIKLSVAECDDEQIKLVSQKLKEVGFGELADYYYQSESCNCPFFKLAKKYQKEQEWEPEYVYVFFDVSDEYTVTGMRLHEHFSQSQLDDAVRFAADVYTGVLCEVCFVSTTMRAGFFMPNTGDPEKNVGYLSSHLKEVMDIVSIVVGGLYQGVHVHHYFQPSFPHYLKIDAEKNPEIAGKNMYLTSVVFAEQTEYYL